MGGGERGSEGRRRGYGGPGGGWGRRAVSGGGDGRRMGPLPLWVRAGCRCDRHAEWVTVT
jgi:hypothetical protein